MRASGLIVFLSSLTALLASMLVTAAVRRVALQRNMLDLPGRRRSHTLPTPRGGGVGVLAGALLPLLALAWWYRALDAAMIAYVAGAAMVAAVGWRDDVGGVAAIYRLAVHAAAAALFVLALHRAGGMAASPVFAFVAGFAIVSLINIWNFMDGINGIASSQAALLALALALLLGNGTWMLAALFLAIACLGFLPFNMPSARVFLGDVGSGSIGFMVAALLTQAVASSALRWPLALLLVSAFAVDSALTLGKRVVQGKAWWRPHREHTYQWLVRAGYPHWQVTLAYFIWSVLAVAWVIALPYGADVVPVALWLLATALIWIALRAHARRKLRRTM